MTRSAAGGSGTVGGVRHEDRCLAWLAADMLAETALPEWASGRLVVGVGCQTGRPVDDVGALTDVGGWVCVQAKKNWRAAMTRKAISPRRSTSSWPSIRRVYLTGRHTQMSFDRSTPMSTGC